MLGLFYYASISQVCKTAVRLGILSLIKEMTHIVRVDRVFIQFCSIRRRPCPRNNRDRINISANRKSDCRFNSINRSSNSLRSGGRSSGWNDLSCNQARSASARRAKRAINVSKGLLTTALTPWLQTREQARRIPTTTTHG